MLLKEQVNILVIDDEINVIKAIIRTLNKPEYQLSYTTCPEEGIELINNNSFDIVICDQRMPNITGMEVLNYLRKTSSKTIGILITGYSDIEVAISCINEGSVYRYIEKPWDNEQLNSIIEEAVTYKVDSEVKDSMVEELLRENLRQKINLMSLNEKIIKNKNEVINGLLKIMKVRDREIYEHGQKVANYAMMLAENIGLSYTRKENLEYAAYFHDIGKIAIREDILYKPSKLDEDEFNLIKNHAAVGAEILSEFHFLKSISEIVRQHHEKINGKGYPHGLKGDDIILEAKILSIADCFDAITSNRVYRKEMDIEEAMKILQQEIGQSYDKELVDNFVKVLIDL